jgi:hypothetical protein
MGNLRSAKPIRLTNHCSLLFFFLFATCSCCFPQQGRQLHETVKFVNFLKENQQQAVFDNTYHVDFNVTDSENRKFYVNKAAKLIARYGLPATDKWLYSYNPTNVFDRYQFRIRLFDGFDSTTKLLHAAIIVSFPPPEISYKIYSYEIETKYLPSPIQPLVPVPVADSIK